MQCQKTEFHPFFFSIRLKKDMHTDMHVSKDRHSNQALKAGLSHSGKLKPCKKKKKSVLKICFI